MGAWPWFIETQNRKTTMKKPLSIYKYCLFCLTMLISFNGIAVGEEHSMIWKKGNPDSLEMFYAWMDLSTEGPYGQTMLSRKHPDGRLAPEFLRNYIDLMDPQRIYFTQGVDFSDGTLTFWWMLDELAVKGSKDSLLIRTNQYLNELDYKAMGYSPLFPKMKQYILLSGTKICTFMIADSLFTSGNNLSCEKMRFQIQFCTSVLPPSAAAMVKLYPALYCAELPTGLFGVLKKRPFKSISYGGTWERYYGWEITTPFPTEDVAADVRKTLIQAILDYGFTFVSESGGITVFKIQFSETTSYVYLSNPTELLLKMRFQPNS